MTHYQSPPDSGRAAFRMISLFAAPCFTANLIDPDLLGAVKPGGTLLPGRRGGNPGLEFSRLSQCVMRIEAGFETG